MILANIFQPLINIFEGLLVAIHSVIPSWGLSIIALTIVVRAALLPLTFKQLKSMQNMQRLAPEIKKLPTGASVTVEGEVAGIIWGSKLGVQFSLSVLALKALPLVILGGLTSVPGAIVGGLILGVGEKLAEVFIGPMLGGGIEIWFAYVLALAFLLIRPQGLFGKPDIKKV